MKLASRWQLLVFITIGFAQLSAAQMGAGMRPPDVAGVFNPTVGSGASYEMTKSDGEKVTFDMAVVDKDAVRWILGRVCNASAADEGVRLFEGTDGKAIR